MTSELRTSKELTRSRDYYRRAQAVIPCATNTLSRGPDNWIQGVSPNFLQRGEGAYVFDVDGNRYIDYSAGLGPTILGYGHPIIVEAVTRQLKDGTVFAMCHPLEVELSELLCAVIPSSQMVRLGRNGSDVVSAAVRLARAYTGRDVVLCCGYHGFQDWYIGTTERNAGVPQAVRNLTRPFHYNDLDGLQDLLTHHSDNVACVIMEPVYADKPRLHFLETVKRYAHEAGAVLIYDEIFTGFRWAIGGAQEYFGVTPDLACFSKAMANGMPISALVGCRKIMQSFETHKVFYSCTFSGETTGMAAAVACIQYIREHNVIESIWAAGTQIMQRFQELTNRLSVPYISLIGYPPKSSILFESTGVFDFLEIKSLFQQECIRRGLLCIGYHLPGLAHTQKVLDETFAIYEEVVPLVDRAVRNGQVVNLLEGPVLQPIFANVGDRSGGPSIALAKR